MGHVVQVLFHAGGEAVIHQVGEAFGQALRDDVAHLLGIEAAIVQRDVTAVLDGGNDRRIGRGSTNTALFHFLDQTGFGETRRWLGEVLARVELQQLQGLALGHIRQYVVFAWFALLGQYTGITVELENAAFGTQLVVACSDRDAGGQVLCRRHLTGQELAPDQLVQTLGITFHATELGRVGADIGRPDGFVRLLRAFLATVDYRRLRQVLLAEFGFDVAARHLDRVLGQVGRVGTHVSDVARFVQPLRHHHGFLHPEAQAVTGRLL